jgi:hypothetical protein
VDGWLGFRQGLLSLAVILALVVAMAAERFLFKVMVDRMESYRSAAVRMNRGMVTRQLTRADGVSIDTFCASS